MHNYPLNIVVGSIMKDGKCLLIRRLKEPYKNYWAIPGGKLEYGEHVSAGIEREFLEETGVTTKFNGLRGVVSEVLRDKETNLVSGHFLIWVCGLDHVSGEPLRKDEGEVAWFGLEDLEKERDAVIPSDYLMIRRFVLGEPAPFNMHTVRILSGEGGYSIEHTDL